jgi:hypothetical protein
MTSLDFSKLTIIPVLHGRLEFAVSVRQALEALRPDCVAVELPETLTRLVMQGVARLPLLSIIHYPDNRDNPVYLPIEPVDPIIEAVRFGMENDVLVHLVDQDVDAYDKHLDWLPDSYALKRLGHASYCALTAAHLEREDVDPVDAGREKVMAFHLRDLLARHDRVVFVCGLAHAERVRMLLSEPAGAEPMRRVKRDNATLYHLAEESSREVMAEAPYLSSAFEKARAGGPAALDELDRLKEQVALAQLARSRYEKNWNDEIPASALSVLFRFARNYALVEGRLAPDLYQLLVAARGAVDDDYGYEVWDLATHWPFQTETPELPVIILGIEDLYEHARYIRFHRRQKTRRKNLLRLVRPRKHERRPGEWKDRWQGDSLCSYQPEDLVVESYGDFLKKKAKGILSAEQSRVEPFTASLLDGIDIRETLRNWHQGRLYVREHQVVRGSVGAVVVVFDEDRGSEEQYPWTMTWQGEHDQESDMAFYATPAAEKLVGPGISRCEYGGFVMTYPPGRMFHVFEDPYFTAAESKSERLLLTAIDYSQERIIVYVAAKPPRSLLKSHAEKFGKKVVYIPIADLSPVTLRQVRVFHVLDGYPVRKWAKEYVR